MREFVVLSDETKRIAYDQAVEYTMSRTGLWPLRVHVSPVAELINGTLHVKASATAGQDYRVVMVELKVKK